jgi:hypothetical protein
VPWSHSKCNIRALGRSTHTLLLWRMYRELFRRNAETIVETSGWGLLFQFYDADGSGVLDFEEFIGASRTDLNISTGDVSDADIKRIFDSADLDGGGEISSEEFVEWLSKNVSNTPDSFFEELIARFITTAKAKVLGLGWKALWAKYDADQSDELDQEGKLIQTVSHVLPTHFGCCCVHDVAPLKRDRVRRVHRVCQNRMQVFE